MCSIKKTSSHKISLIRTRNAVSTKCRTGHWRAPDNAGIGYTRDMDVLWLPIFTSSGALQLQTITTLHFKGDCFYGGSTASRYRLRSALYGSLNVQSSFVACYQLKTYHLFLRTVYLKYAIFYLLFSTFHCYAEWSDSGARSRAPNLT